MSDEKDKGTNLVALPGGGNTDALRDGVRLMKKNMELLIEYWAIDAKIKRAKFLSLKEAGFSDEQALELTKAHL